MTDNPHPEDRGPDDRDPHQGRDIPAAHNGGVDGPSRDGDTRPSPEGGLSPARGAGEAPPPADAGAGEGAPFGLPVLGEVPELAALLEDLVSVDRTLARVLEGLIRLQDHSVAEATTGLPLERWLAAIARRTGSDRRMLATAATACRRLPCLRAAFGRGTVSWAQVRSVALKIERLPGYLDDRLDAAVADAIAGAGGADPDALCSVITWTLKAIEADATPEAPDPEPAEADWFAMQPRLDHTGGEVHGEFGTEGFALLDAALNTGPAPEGRSRAGVGADADVEASRANGRQLARGRAERLKQLCRTGRPTGQDDANSDVDPDGTGSTSDGVPDGAADTDAGSLDADGEAADGPAGVVAPNQTILRAELDTLLARMPAALLTRLTGGRLHVDAATARRLMDTYGTRLRLVLTDHGRIVGVGRASRQPPGWLADAVLALHDTCSEPGCNIAARTCDLDHARPWADRDRPGRTDVDQLAPLCATANHDKEAAGWTVSQQADGVRVWSHARTGLTTRTLPATWRPPPRDPPDSPPRNPPEAPPRDPPDPQPWRGRPPRS